MEATTASGRCPPQACTGRVHGRLRSPLADGMGSSQRWQGWAVSVGSRRSSRELLVAARTN
jgi:hypothetical protein